MVLGRPAELRRLEAIVHPAGPRQRSAASCAAPAGRAAELVVLDVPLLFETGGERRVDAVAVVWASPMLQAQRALRRPGMTAERLARIRAQQLPDPWKRAAGRFRDPLWL